MPTVQSFPAGGYRFISHQFQYSGGVAAEPGFRVPPQSCRPLCGAEPSLSSRLAVVTGFPRRRSCHGSAFEAHGVPGLRATRLPAYRSRS